MKKNVIFFLIMFVSFSLLAGDTVDFKARRFHSCGFCGADSAMRTILKQFLGRYLLETRGIGCPKEQEASLLGRVFCCGCCIKSVFRKYCLFCVCMEFIDDYKSFRVNRATGGMCRREYINFFLCRVQKEHRAYFDFLPPELDGQYIEAQDEAEMLFLQMDDWKDL
ncbi:hypothetical protein HN446_02325 [bacterium]|jgi:hypothetical protein|nr:hypothetical protein [bacterium]